MPIRLIRVDERLIHGQVAIGWGSQLHPDRIIVIDDALSEATWEQELYALGLPPDVSASFVSVATAVRDFDEWQSGRDRVFVLTRDIATMARLAEAGALAGQHINIGGLHDGAGRRQVLPYVFLNDAEQAALERLLDLGIDASAQDLPGTRRVPAQRLVRDAASS
ncbi:MAG: PTS sugar transporter subunit IIB [Gemmatimonadetes bacterium]|nr:PTS sugar transporter subunit IIB [Gemmatimonadota bacterium]